LIYIIYEPQLLTRFHTLEQPPRPGNQRRPHQRIARSQSHHPGL